MIKTFALILAFAMLALVAWALLFGSGVHIMFDGEEVNGPLKGVVGGGSLLIAIIGVFCAAIFLAFVFAGVGLFVLGMIVLAALVVAGISLPFLLVLFIPLAIVWGFIALLLPKRRAP